MKKFLLKILLFGLPILLTAFPLDFFISKNLKKLNDSEGEFEIWNDIYAGKAVCDIAVYGSSRASSHINSQVLENEIGESVYNFGTVAQFTDAQLARHSEFLKYNRKPKLVILSLDIFGLAPKQDLYAPEQYLPYLLYNENLRGFLKNYKDFSTLDFYLPLLRYRGKRQSLRRALANVRLNADSIEKRKYKGFYGIKADWKETNAPNKARYKMPLTAPMIAAFERLLDDCKEKNINVVLVYTPEYIENQETVENHREVIDFYRQSGARRGFPLLDYSSDEMCLDKKNFFDYQHLNERAAKIFTAKLAQHLKEMLR